MLTVGKVGEKDQESSYEEGWERGEKAVRCMVGSGRKGKGEYCTVIVVGSGETDKECGRGDKWDNRIMKTIDGEGGEEHKEK